MEPFKTVKSIATPLDKVNIDTDQIVPKQFLKLVQKTGFGEFLFYDWRYDEKGSKRNDFVLNDPKYDGSSILVTGENFGCGSSREHAVWALLDYGFTVVIAPSFADIFFSNCFKNGILPISVGDETLKTILSETGPIQINLEEQLIITSTDKIHFDIDPHRKRVLLDGLDEIAQTLEFEDQITKFESNSKVPSVL